MTEARNRIPKVTSRPPPDELRRLPLTPVDGFVLSRVDDTASEEDIAVLTGLPRDQVLTSLERLADLGLVSLGDDGPQRKASSVANKAVGAISAAPPSGPTEAGRHTNDLSSEERTKIIEFFAGLDALDHYALLGVGRIADKKEIKRAYFERAALFHPDRYFRRNVGDLKPKLETIFARVTNSHDVLTDKAKRAEYDTYLANVALTRELEGRIREGEERVRAAQVVANADNTNAAAIKEGTLPPGPLPREERSPTAASSANEATATSSGSSKPPADATDGPRRPAALDAQARRELLAKHLRGGRSLTPGKIAPVRPSDPALPAMNQEVVRRHFEQRKQDRARGQAMRHKQAGDQARATGDLIAAASSYKAALSFVPEDPELQKLYTETSTLSETEVAATYQKQAAYEEKNEKWSEAAKTWAKIARLLRHDPGAQASAANALVNADGNLHDAAGFAVKATSLAPQNAEYRKLLATIYLEAGLFKNAKREIDAAHQLAPQDDSIAALVRRLANAMANKPGA